MSISAAVNVDGGYVEKKAEHKPPNVIDFYNQVECATGCGGTITFQRNVKTVMTEYTCQRTFTSTFGTTISAGAKIAKNWEAKKDETTDALNKEGELKASLSFGCSVSEVQTNMIRTEFKVSDKCETSTLYIYHCYHGYDFIRYKWLKNDLHLTPGDEMCYTYEKEQYLKVNSESCESSEKRTVKDANSPLTVNHEGGRHRAILTINFDPKYLDKDGVYIGSLAKKRQFCEISDGGLDSQCGQKASRLAESSS